MVSENEFDRALDGLAPGSGSSDGGSASLADRSARQPHPSVEAMRARFGDAVLRHEQQAGDEHVVFVVPASIREIMGWLKDDASQGYDYLKDVTAVDYGGGRPLQVVYELWSMSNRRQLRVKAELPLDALEVDSVVPLWETANWLEREVFDLFGIRFLGHPDLRRIMMPDNYAEGHPLRKDFPLRGRFSRAEQTRRALALDFEDYYTPAELAVVRDPDPTGERRKAGSRDVSAADHVPEGGDGDAGGQEEAEEDA